MSVESENKAADAIAVGTTAENVQAAAPAATTESESKEVEQAPSSSAAPDSKAEAAAKDPAPEAPSTNGKEVDKGSATAATTKPLDQFFADLPSIIKEADYGEMWGIELADQSHVPTAIVLEKFLRANPNDINKAKSQLLEALKWRKLLQPHKILDSTEFDGSKFGELGYVTTYVKPDGGKEIVTWNIYGAVKDKKATFGNVDECVAMTVCVILNIISLTATKGLLNGDAP